jgi:hypothetical protein
LAIFATPKVTKKLFAASLRHNESEVAAEELSYSERIVSDFAIVNFAYNCLSRYLRVISSKNLQVGRSFEKCISLCKISLQISAFHFSRKAF